MTDIAALAGTAGGTRGSGEVLTANQGLGAPQKERKHIVETRVYPATGDNLGKPKRWKVEDKA